MQGCLCIYCVYNELHLEHYLGTHFNQCDKWWTYF